MPFDSSLYKVIFDGDNKQFIVKDGVTIIDFQEDIYFVWKDWILDGDNFSFEQAISVIGGEVIPNRYQTTTNFILVNNWKIKLYSGTYNIRIIGNVFADDSSSIIEPADIVAGVENNILVELETSNDTDTSDIGDRLDSILNQISSLETKVDTIDTNTTPPVPITLNAEEAFLLNDLHYMLTEMYKINGLDPNVIVEVSKERREAGIIAQDFTKSDDGEKIVIRRV